MPRFDFQSPGAAATVGVQEFLKQRNADQRQAMLDELTRQDTQHDWAVQNSNIDLNKIASDRAGELQKHNITGDLVKELPIAGANVEDIGNPDVVKRLEGTGNIRTSPGTGGQVIDHSNDPAPEADPLTGTVAEAPQTEGATFKSSVTAPSRRYIGGKEQQGIDMRQAQIDEMMRSNPDLAKDQDTARGLALVRGGAVDNLPASLVGPPPSVTPIEWNTGKAKPTIQGERGTTFMELNPGPSAYFGGGAGNRPLFVGMDNNTGQPVVQDRDGSFRIAPVQGNIDLAPKPSVGRAIPAGLQTRFAQAKGNVAELQNRYQGQMWGGKSNDLINAEAAYNALRNEMVAATGIPPNILDTASDIINHPVDRTKTVSQLVAEGTIQVGEAPEQFNAQELQQLQQAIGILQQPLTPQNGK